MKSRRVHFVLLLMCFFIALLSMTAGAKSYYEKLKSDIPEEEGKRAIYGKYLKVSWPSDKIALDAEGIGANKGITVAVPQNKILTKLEIRCGFRPDKVSKKKLSVSRGKISWNKKKKKIVITGINASKVKFKCKSTLSQFDVYKAYFTDNPSFREKTKITISKPPQIRISQGEVGQALVSVRNLEDTITNVDTRWNILSVRIQYSTDKSFKKITGSYDLAKRETAGGFALPEQATYYFRAKYVGGDGCSKWSRTISAKIQ